MKEVRMNSTLLSYLQLSSALSSFILMKLAVLKNPDPLLRRKALPVEADFVVSKEAKDFVRDMKDTMRVENGVGLAATQVGVDKRVIIAENDGVAMAIFNPEIFNLSFAKVSSEEGCLSVPGIWGLVKRHRTVDWKGLDESGKAIGGRANGLFAIILQHEIDHLDGILFIDKTEKFIKESKSAI